MTEKNKIQVKISYLMIALTVARCIYPVIEEVSEDLSLKTCLLTNLNLKRKALLREAVMKAKTEQKYLCLCTHITHTSKGEGAHDYGQTDGHLQTTPSKYSESQLGNGGARL